MAKSIRMKAVRTDNNETRVIAILKHPMETGARKDTATGELIAAHYIREIVCKHNDAVVLSIDAGPSVSKDPKIKFRFKGGNKGDEVTISWTDNKNQSDSASTKIK